MEEEEEEAAEEEEMTAISIKICPALPAILT